MFFCFSYCISNQPIEDELNEDYIEISFSKTTDRINIDSTHVVFNQFIALETNDSCLIRYISRLYIDEDKLFILDSSLDLILIFDTLGNYLNRIYPIGRGPGEYLGVEDIYIDTIRKEIIVSCDRPAKLMFFNYKGEFMSEKRQRDNNFYSNIIKQNDMLYADISLLNQSKDVVVMDSSGKNLYHILNSIKSRTTLFISGNNMNEGKNNIYYTRRFDYNIYEIKDGDFRIKYKLNFGEHTLPRESLNYEIEHFQKFCSENQYIFSITEVQEGDKYLIFRTNIGTFVLNKESYILQKVRAISNSYINNVKNLYLGVGSGKIASIYNSEIFADFNEQIHTEEDKNWYVAKEYEYLLDRNEDDNPVLFIYDIR